MLCYYIKLLLRTFLYFFNLFTFLSGRNLEHAFKTMNCVRVEKKIYTKKVFDFLAHKCSGLLQDSLNYNYSTNYFIVNTLML